MPAASADLGAEFRAKIPELVNAFSEWFAEAEAPAGAGGSIISARPAIDSKRVLDATCVTEEVLGISLPAKLIRPGGYASCEEMVNDLIPKLEQTFIEAKSSGKGAKAKAVENA